MTESLRERLETLRHDVERELAAAADPQAVEEIRVRILGRKGALTTEAKGLGALPPADRPMAGGLVNAVKEALEAAIETRAAEVAGGALARRLEAEALDVTLPGRRRGQGTRHPLSIVTAELLSVFWRMGFEVASGPDSGSVVRGLVLAFVLGLAVVGLYRASLVDRVVSPSMNLTLVLLSMVTSLVMMVIGDSLARAFSLVGS